MPLSISLKGPLVLLGVGVLLALVTYPKADVGAPFIAVAILWALVTGRSRRTYWDARLRARARQDERAERSS